MATALVYEDNATGWRTFQAGDLPASGVTPATYGDSTHVAQVTIDAAGVVTAASSVAISAGSGTVSLITSSGGTLTVSNGAGPTANLDMPTTGVTPATYGDANHVGQFTVDAEGRITSASVVNITGSGGSGATAAEATTVAGLGTPSDGAIGRIRAGSSPYDFLTVIYDSTYGHWVSEERIGKMTTAAGTSTTSGSFANYLAAAQTMAIFPQRVFINAGLTLQLRAFALCNVSGGGITGTFSPIITGFDVGGADSTTLAGGTLQVTQTSATRSGIDSGWTSVTPSTTTDLMDFGFLFKTSGGTFSILHAGLLFRWIG